MKDPRITLLATNLLDYSIEIQPGEKLLIEARGLYSLELVKELIRLTTERGAIPVWYYNDEELLRHFVGGATEEQMQAFTAHHLTQTKDVQCYIAIRGSENAFSMADLPEEKMKQYNQIYIKKVHLEHRVPHTRWCVLRFPNSAMAQLAETSQEAFEDFYFRVCNLDYRRLSAAMDPLQALMDRTDQVHIKGPGTDLRFSIKDIPSVKCHGDRNIPDGEVFTAPVRDSVNGTLAFNAPALRDGTLYTGLRFSFENGRIVAASCDGDDAKLNEYLDTDDGARYIGEFSLGTNPFIHHPMKDTLFDEKIYGSFHFTPGQCYKEAFNGNDSAIHWDLVCIQTPEYGGGEIWFDGVLIRKDGTFVHPELTGLNKEHFEE